MLPVAGSGRVFPLKRRPEFARPVYL